MMTEAQLTAEIYNAIESIVPTFWISRPTQGQTFPLAVYKMIDVDNSYSFGINREAEERMFQIDLYIDPSEQVSGENLYDSIKTAMESLDYRLTGSQADFLDSDTNKVIKTSRWERFNV